MKKRMAVIGVVASCLVLFCSSPKAEEGCPSGQLRSVLQKKCVKVSSYNAQPLDDRQPMKFGAYQVSMTMIFLQGIGAINRETPEEFRKFMATDDAKMSKVLMLHSPGGNLLAGLQLGRQIRAARLNTSIGRSLHLEGVMDVCNYPNAMCASACAYAFLGGVSRSYSEEDFFGLHRFGSDTAPVSGDDAQLVSAELAKYLQEMGVDQAVLQAASGTAYKGDIFSVSVALAKKMRVIFDPSSQTTFQVEDRNGKAVAVFAFSNRERRYDGLLFCESGRRYLAIIDRDNSVPSALRAMTDFPAEFSANGRMIGGYATYIAQRGATPSMVFFAIPLLDHQSFGGAGLSLSNIVNPHMSPSKSSLGDRFAWADAVTTLSFQPAFPG